MCQEQDQGISFASALRHALTCAAVSDPERAEVYSSNMFWEGGGHFRRFLLGAEVCTLFPFFRPLFSTPLLDLSSRPLFSPPPFDPSLPPSARPPFFDSSMKMKTNFMHVLECLKWHGTVIRQVFRPDGAEVPEVLG